MQIKKSCIINNKPCPFLVNGKRPKCSLTNVPVSVLTTCELAGNSEKQNEFYAKGKK